MFKVASLSETGHWRAGRYWPALPGCEVEELTSEALKALREDPRIRLEEIGVCADAIPEQEAVTAPAAEVKPDMIICRPEDYETACAMLNDEPAPEPAIIPAPTWKAKRGRPRKRGK
jgi:hypothetical protein